MKKLICLLCVLTLLLCVLSFVGCKKDVVDNGGGDGTTDTTPEGTTPPDDTISGDPTPEGTTPDDPNAGVVEGTNDPAQPDQSW